MVDFWPQHVIYMFDYFTLLSVDSCHCDCATISSRNVLKTALQPSPGFKNATLKHHYFYTIYSKPVIRRDIISNLYCLTIEKRRSHKQIASLQVATFEVTI